MRIYENIPWGPDDLAVATPSTRYDDLVEGRVMRFKEGDIVEILGISRHGSMLADYADPSMTFQTGDLGIAQKLLKRSSFLHVRHLNSLDVDLLMMYDARLYCAERWVWD